MSKVKFLSNIMVGLFLSSFWLLIGTIVYINSISALAVFNIEMKHLIYFLWGIPAILVIFGVIFIKKLELKISLISFLAGTIFFALIIPALLE